jgi:hypothetical protein
MVASYSAERQVFQANLGLIGFAPEEIPDKLEDLSGQPVKVLHNGDILPDHPNYSDCS